MNEPTVHSDDFEDDIERAVDDKHDGVLAADATGMIRGEETTRLVEIEDELENGEIPARP